MILQYFSQKKPDSELVGLPVVQANDANLKNGLAIAFGVAAAVSVLTIVFAAINFATAGSDTEKISRSKKAILFALIGLAISLSAEAIVLVLLGSL